jgi:hypothetical protein
MWLWRSVRGGFRTVWRCGLARREAISAEGHLNNEAFLMASPTSRTLTRLRRLGYLADVCERFIAQANIRRDLFGAFDVVAVRRGQAGILGVQTTSLPNLPARVAKLRQLPAVALWLACGNAVELHGWAKRGTHWRVKVVVLSGEDLQPVVVEAPRRRLPVRHQQGDLYADL